jgi:hypothetical protein
LKIHREGIARAAGPSPSVPEKEKQGFAQQTSNNVIRWIKRLLSPEPPRSNPAIAEDFHRRLHLAKLRAAVAGDDGARDDGRSSEQMSPPPTFEITPELSRTGLVPPEWLLRARDETLLAAALESILQGERVANEVFLQLYRHGFVFKEKEKKWAITEAGKQLIERHKLQGLQECRVHGLKCRKSWI